MLVDRKHMKSTKWTKQGDVLMVRMCGVLLVTFVSKTGFKDFLSEKMSQIVDEGQRGWGNMGNL